jgi:hypothetical protein
MNDSVQNLVNEIMPRASCMAPHSHPRHAVSLFEVPGRLLKDRGPIFISEESPKFQKAGLCFNLFEKAQPLQHATGIWRHLDTSADLCSSTKSQLEGVLCKHLTGVILEVCSKMIASRPNRRQAMAQARPPRPAPMMITFNIAPRPLPFSSQGHPLRDMLVLLLVGEANAA